ncbi:ferrous iron transport protein B [Blautia sp. HCN-1074]|jgi:ferrous iron transport protein B|uniref:ferrous iron transport protein B n=1 Tax=Blautia sp. HCN-1074 TaxID=3134667 RepID=UPI000E4304D6|nr:ferrous iron transport protein B [Ruminococcus sp. TM10-9AT]RGW16971.1 ferrous iron transport protein B [Ruminococcus sp. AF13-37]RGW18897.1 ferrous iron transport protein B [Ruminococcus sp. AF13-28]RHT48537.1 ferrous iron transport protein B [Ruminococcus sp. AM29-26]
MTLKDLEIGKSAVIRSVGGKGALRQHFLDMGMIPGAEVTVVKFAPMGDPMELQVHGYELTLRLAEAEQIEIEQIPRRSRSHKGIESMSDAEHPGLGEEGKYHSKKDEHPLPEGTTLTYALVGNQNCGKTTLFNKLTGSNQHVGNFPGVTVDRKTGSIKGHPNTEITDLPGIYSMSPYSSEEIVSRNFVLDEKPSAIINIVDATNIERNLYLTMQLLEMDIPMVVALNMMDEVLGNQGSIDVNMMEALLGVPVIPISAAKNEGVDELVNHALHIAKYQEHPLRQDFCDKNDHDGAVHRCIHAVMHLIEDHATLAGIPSRFAATKAIEGDPLIMEKLKLDTNETEMLEHIVQQMETERQVDRSAAIADMRFDFIERLCEQTVVKPKESKERIRSEKIDRILTGKYTAIPCFIGIMALVFYLTFNVIGAWLQGILEIGIDKISALTDAALTAANVNSAMHSLVIDGIFTGVGSVLSFLPVIVTLFFFLSLMEDSGYIARVAFVMDKLLRKIGLSGRSIVPMLIGFGCTVPAVMATRTLTSERDRKMTILLTPFMSCTAKLPIYSFFVNAFFPKKGGLIMTGLYLLGIFVGILAALLYNGTLFKGEPVPFVMELPNYRLPGAKNVAQLLWEKAKDFLQRAFSVILLATMIVWFLQSFDLHLNLVKDSSDSILAMAAGLLVPIFKPLGLGDWRICTALISGFMAKESVVSTLEVLFSGSIASVLTPLAAASLLAFSLLYTPCVAAIASVKRELGGRWAIGVVVWQCVVAWIVALIVRFVAAFII